MTGRHVIAVVAVVCSLLAVPALVRPAPAPHHAPPASSPFDLDAERIAAAAASRSRPTTTSSSTSTTSTTRPAPPTSGFAPSNEEAKEVHPHVAGELIGRFTVTCYGPGDGFPAGQHTATGDPVGPGSVAVDPRIIPLGTELILEGLDDEAVANDTGGAIRGYHVDEWRADCSRNDWGNPTVNIYRR